MANSTYNSKILGTGAYLPERVVTNLDLEKMVDTSDKWIRERTGIKMRRLASKDGGEYCSDMGVYASQKAIEAAAISPNDIDYILLATITPDYRLPNTGSVIQQKLGIENECPCLDISAACSGFVYGFELADALIKAGSYKNILIVCSEMLSPYVDWDDRTTCILFSDGAGAIVVGRTEGDESSVLSQHVACDGSGGEYLKCWAGGCVHPSDHESVDKKGECIRMEGRRVFKYATRTMIQNIKEALMKANLTVANLNWFLPHQANLRIIEYVAKNVEIEMDRVLVTVDKYGNNSSATIPIALDEAIRDGRVKRGDIIGFDAFGAGVTSGAMVIKY